MTVSAFRRARVGSVRICLRSVESCANELTNRESSGRANRRRGI
jgi:hypothetical protein